MSQFRSLIYRTALKRRRRNPKLFKKSSGLLNYTTVANEVGVDHSTIKRICTLERVFTSDDPNHDHGEYNPTYRLKQGLIHWVGVANEAELIDELEHAEPAPDELKWPDPESQDAKES